MKQLQNNFTTPEQLKRLLEYFMYDLESAIVERNIDFSKLEE